MIPPRISSVPFRQECVECWLSPRGMSVRPLAAMALKLKLDTTSPWVTWSQAKL